MELEGVNAKIERAREGLQGLEADISAYCKVQRNRILFEQSLPYDYALGNPPSDNQSSVPTNYSIRVGEIAYNLRSSLDHLVWQLVQANGRQPSGRNEFPIFDIKGKYDKACRRKLNGVNQDRQKLINEFQPFGHGEGVGKHLLMLKSICNIDKHRHLTVVAVHSFVDMTQAPLDPIVEVCFVDKELEEKSPGYDLPMEREGIKRPPVVPVLISCLAAVDFVVGQLSGQAHMLIFERKL